MRIRFVIRRVYGLKLVLEFYDAVSYIVVKLFRKI